MTQKNLLYFVTRFNLLMHHAELNYAYSMQALMQMVHELQGSVTDIEIKVLGPEDAYAHFLLSLEAVDRSRSVAREAASWIADHRDEMSDVLELEARMRAYDPELLLVPDDHLELYREGAAEYFLELERQMKSVNKRFRRDLVDSKILEKLKQAYTDENIAVLLAFYEQTEWLRPRWVEIHRLHGPFSLRVMRTHMK